MCKVKEGIHTQKMAYYMIPFIGKSIIGKYIDKGSVLVVAWAERGAMGSIANGCDISFWDDENVLKLIIVMIAQLFEYSKNPWIVHVKSVNYKVYEIYLNKTIKNK